MEHWLGLMLRIWPRPYRIQKPKKIIIIIRIKIKILLNKDAWDLWVCLKWKNEEKEREREEEQQLQQQQQRELQVHPIRSTNWILRSQDRWLAVSPGLSSRSPPFVHGWRAWNPRIPLSMAFSILSLNYSTPRSVIPFKTSPHLQAIGLTKTDRQRTNLETSSQRGPFSVASRKAASISDRIFSNASVSWRGHRLPGTPPRSASSPAAARASSSGKFPGTAGPNSSKFIERVGGGRLLIGDAASAVVPKEGIPGGGGTPYWDPPPCCIIPRLRSSAAASTTVTTTATATATTASTRAKY